ncbi:3-phosphoserine/phosphohydroxythreonine transaminase [Bacillota bacterium]
MKESNRVYNFSAGPSVLPLPVLEQAANEMVNYGGSGMSVMEMSHRSKEFAGIIETAEQDLRDLMDIPDSYKVLFLQGGGYLQFSMIPINLFRNSYEADFVITGSWAKNAAKEAERLGKVNILASSEADNFTYIPDDNSFMGKRSKDADYFYITYNNTIYGSRFTKIPDTGNVPLVADLSSMILSQELDVSKFGLVFAGAQKNIGPAGVTIVIIREDLIGLAPKGTPSMLDYKVHADAGSLFNTPPCYAIYIAGLTFKWIKSLGGVGALQKKNEEKAGLLYKAIDESRVFSCPVAAKDRSLMNAVFVTGDEGLDKKFIAGAEVHGLVNLGGHRSIGGMRASIYNAMPYEGVEALVAYMKEFENNL